MSMSQILRHHLRRAQAGQHYNAVANCHTHGLHSIVLHDQPDNRCRIFYADSKHELWRNTEGSKFSIGIHAHHCDLTLIGLTGTPRSVQYAILPAADGDFEKCRYVSPFSGKPGSIVPTGEFAYMHKINSVNLDMMTLDLKAHQLHTVYVDKGQSAAWMILEGGEDRHYQSVFWSNATCLPMELVRSDALTPAGVASILEKILKEYRE